MSASWKWMHQQVIYESKFSTKSQSKWIPVYPQADGILEIGANVSVYDKDKGSSDNSWYRRDQQVFVPNVKEGDSILSKTGRSDKRWICGNNLCKKDNVTPLQTNILYTQSGRIKIFIKNSKRIREASKAFISNHLITVIKMLHSTFKKWWGVWKTITNRMIAAVNDHKR